MNRKQRDAKRARQAEYRARLRAERDASRDASRDAPETLMPQGDLTRDLASSRGSASASGTPNPRTFDTLSDAVEFMTPEQKRALVDRSLAAPDVERREAEQASGIYSIVSELLRSGLGRRGYYRDRLTPMVELLLESGIPRDQIGPTIVRRIELEEERRRAAARERLAYARGALGDRSPRPGASTPGVRAAVDQALARSREMSDPDADPTSRPLTYDEVYPDGNDGTIVGTAFHGPSSNGHRS